MHSTLGFSSQDQFQKRVASGSETVQPNALSFGPLTFGAFFVVALAVAVFTSHSASAQDPTAGMTPEERYEYEMMGMGDEMDMYAEGSMGGRGSRGPRGASSEALMTGRLASIAEALGTADFSALTDASSAPPVAAGPVLANEALVAYTKGNHALAMRLFFGHIVAEHDDAGDAARLVKFSKLMKRPAWQVRWGVSYAVRGDAVEPQPIQESASRGMYGGGMDEMDMEMGMQMGQGRGGRPGMDEQMEMQMQMEMDMEMGMGMEEDMMEMERQMQMEMRGMSGQGPGMGGRPGMGKPPVKIELPSERLANLERSLLSADAEKQMQDNLGLVATMLGEEFDKRYVQGDFGRAMTEVVGDTAGETETISAEFVELLESTADPMPLWRPNMVFLGKGDSKINLSIARENDIDVMLHIDVLLKDIRGQFVQTICRCRLMHVPTGKSLGISKSIDSLELAQQQRAKNKDSRAYVSDQISNLIGIIDRQVKTSEMPNLTPDVARRRVGQLLASGGGQNLRTLAEVRLFQRQKLLTDEEVLMAFDIVGGQEALQLIYGTEEEKLATVRNWAGKLDASEDADF